MRQPTPTIPVTSKMLRHFAVVTVAITACIGIFAQGENAEVAAKPAQAAAAPEESGGGMFDFGGGGDGGGGGGGGEGSGFIQSAPPTMRSTPYGPAARISAADEGNGYTPPTNQLPIPKDTNGVPAPGAAVTAVNPARPGKPQPPRKASQQDIDRMMAASSQRSGRATAD
jgi:hypothetical protein